MSGARETIHATTVAISRGGGWRGVLLAGRSGAGKSDLALRLIDRGARLVADDYTDLHEEDGVLIATPPGRIAGRIEVRGIGIVEMACLPAVPVALLVALDEPVERMPEARVRHLAGIAVPLVALAALEGSAPIKVELALAGIAG
ncbi:HPr kinase/phosphorylase [Sphingomonas profundi]|uniref:HPr kinase/phosphorylase n=1 Tax=Alterirhizorhabdus profundi TaxID=2681549 RepID=UPI001E3F6F60|nr:aldolase [Sphingomonas profundi]